MTRAEILKIAKPILFNTEMVKAILEGRKTVTRRICKDGNGCTVPDMSFYDADKRTYAVHNYADAEHTEKLSIAERKVPICPGDILYVRETWFIEEYYDDEALIRFKAGGKQGLDYEAEGKLYHKLNKFAHDKWNPSLFMPKETARIFLKVKDVRVEQLQDITPEQAVCEGTKEQFPPLAVDEFRDIWNSTIKKSDLARYGWDANPWVWVIEFERIEPDVEV